MKHRYISVSVMCSNLMNLGQDIKTLEENGADMLHIDVMDAHFVPNLTFGPDFIKAMQAVTTMPVDVHLMVDDPELIMSKFPVRKGDIVSPHIEVKKDYRALAAKVHEAGGLFGLAVNPETDVEAIKEYLDVLDTVTLMLVHPGAAGAKMVDGIMDKVAGMRRFLDTNGREDILISVDGSVSKERANLMAGMGADIFVGGTAGIYRKGMALSETIPEMQAAIDF
jgi:ribulose-phosphate 3-epimerase|uniref:ribulose-phosphate 3-epimerase n=1 Tax=Candidatus Cryptobacteroides bacterium TaxID=3085639 RepID=UPI0040295F71